jgi:hypothetical protein
MLSQKKNNNNDNVLGSEERGCPSKGYPLLQAKAEWK